MEKVIIVIVLGVIGGLVANKIGLPGGVVVGSMLFSGLAMIFLPGSFVVPTKVNIITQLLLGISLGLTFDASLLKVAGKIFPLAIISTLILLSVAVLMAYIAHKLGLMDFGTALFGFSPGGMTGMSILAQDEGHTGSVVAFLHTVRIFTLFIAVPLLARFAMTFFQNKH